ncbi:MAG: TerB N-terminal domain-containing protein [Ruminococcus sp.]|nr:TerB N-terminal domain-containing protein [Ruminococcus sp.]
MSENEKKRDLEELINMIQNDEKLRSSRAFRDKVYTDEPILRPASLLSPPAVPKRITIMKELAFSSEAVWKTSEWLFCTQGQFMADYEDDFPFDQDFVRLYPNYRDLTSEQLRGYFTWRTGVRKGVFGKAPLPFLYLYAYEMINCIGVRDPEEAFRQLYAIYSAYPEADALFRRRASGWLTDLAAYYRLPTELVSDIPDIVFDNSVLTLIHYEESSDEELYRAICCLSSYRPESSGFISQNGEIFSSVLCRAYRSLADYAGQKNKKPLWEKYFGSPVTIKSRIFQSAIFYDKDVLRNSEYTINEIHSYSCENGSWSCRRINGSRVHSKKLGELVRAADCVMRELCGFRYRLSEDGAAKRDMSAVKTAFEQYTEEKRRLEAMRVEIDLSRLGDIRRAADITRERLLVPESGEYEDTPELPEAAESTVQDTDVPAEAEEMTDTAVQENNAEAEALLDRAELDFLGALLCGGDWRAAARCGGAMPSLLADSINEKLFDTFGDTVISFDGDIPEIVGDYADELREMLGG